jgi:predicted neuraminidase
VETLEDRRLLDVGGAMEDYQGVVAGNVDDFETGDFSKLPWTHSGDANWTITGGDRHAGTYCARSGAITDDQSSTLEVTFDTDAGNLSFWRKVSSEFEYDFLCFHVDGLELGAWSGEQDWGQFTYPVMAGSHTFTWTYEKDFSVSEGSDAAWIDDVVFSPLTAFDLDFGDAATPYPTTLGENGARHAPTGPRLGAYRDWEVDGTHSPRADADDTAGVVDDEDGITLSGVAVSTTAPTMASLEVDLRNADPAANYLDAWIDFNGDGDWADAGEQIFASRDLGTTDGIQTLWFVVPRDTGDNIVSGVTYARFRVSTAGGLSFDGPADDGEVEDYRVAVGGDVEDFESGDFSRFPWTHSGDANWTITSADRHAGTFGARSGMITDDQTSTLELTFDTDDVNLSFWRKVSSEFDYDFLYFSIDGVAREAWSGEQDWEQFTYPVMAGSHTFSWSYVKDAEVSGGVDAAWIDDVALSPLGRFDLDFGDAGASYPTTLAEDGARHMTTGPTLGAYRDWEVDGTHSPRADADDTAGVADDEDGITLSGVAVSTTAPTMASLEVDLRNADPAANYLDAWIDFNGDGDWADAGEQIFASRDLGTTDGIQTLWFVVPRDTGDNIVSGVTYARFRVSTAGGLSFDGPADDGEVEDHRVAVSWFGPPQALNTNAPLDTGWDYVPQIAADGAGNWVTVWESSDSLGGTIGTDTDVLVARSADAGATWTVSAPLNTHAGFDSADDIAPQITTDRLGNWVAMWFSEETQDGTSDFGYDILASRSTDAGATWSEPVSLNTNVGGNAATPDGLKLAADQAGNWVAVWNSGDSLGGTIGSDIDILVSRSTDAGATWTDPAPLNNNAGSDSDTELTPQDYGPQIATDGDGTWLAVWHSYNSLGGLIGLDADILMSRSVDGGATWTDPAPLNSNAGASGDGNDFGVRVTTDGAGNWVAVWVSGDLPVGSNYNILVASSSDSGQTWTTPAPIDASAGPDPYAHGVVDITTDGAGNWLAVWQCRDNLGGTIGTDSDLVVSRSTDAGASWSPAVPLNTNADSDSGYDTSAVVATDGAGNWVTVWRTTDSLGETIGNDWDIVVARSADAGATWSNVAPLNSNAGTDTGQDYTPQLTTDGVGNWVAVWASSDSLGGTIGADRDILVARSTDAGGTWTVAAPLNGNAGSDFGNDVSPQVTTDGMGNWVALWVSDDSLGGTIGDDSDVLVSRSTDAGVTWSVPEPLNTNAATDSGDDHSPQVTTDGAGNWVAVWHSNDSLEGTIGTDADVLVSRSTNAGLTWTAPVALNTGAASDSEYDWDPQATTDGVGNWVAVWESNNSLGETIGTDRDILVSRSTDAGATWTAPAPLNGTAGSDSATEDDVQVTTDGVGNWVAVWESPDSLGGTIGTDIDILIARSTDSGATWSDPVPLGSNADSDSEDDYLSQVTTDAAGNWIAVWTAEDGLQETVECFEVFVSRSADAGVTWTAPVPLSINAGSDFEYDWNPQVTTDGAGNWVAVWDSDDSLGGTIGSDDDILFARFSEYLWDYGDAPAPYPTLLADVGARHLAAGPTLGTGRDVEPDGLPDASALGDDNSGLPDDEDGVTFSPLIPGQTATMTVVVGGGGGVVEAWIDFNGDGAWQHPAEQVYAGLVADGTHQIPVAVPQDAIPGTTFARVRVSSSGGLAPGGLAVDGEVEDSAVTVNGVVARHVFYNNSKWDGHAGFARGDPAANEFDDGAIATDKQALLPGQTGTFANYTSYPRGINGIMVDIQGLADPIAVGDGDLGEFDFKYGNDDTPDDWLPAPTPLEVTVRDIGGGVHRVTFIWADKAIPNKNWLQVTVKEHPNTGLAADDVFYFGNTVGENTGDFRVDYSDAFDIIWPLLGTPLPIGPDHVADINRDGRIDYSDVFDDLWPNLSGPAPLKPIHPPALPVAPLQSTDSVFDEKLSWEIELIWFDQAYGTSSGSHDSDEDNPLQATGVDGVFSVYYEE